MSNFIRQGTIIAREDLWQGCLYEVRAQGGSVYHKPEDEVEGQPRLEVGTRVWFGMEADLVGYMATTKPKAGELVSAVIKKARLYGEERIWVSARSEEQQVRYFVARPWLAAVFGELGSRMTREQRERLVRSIEGQRFQIRPWPRSPWFADLVQRRIRPPRRKTGPPRLTVKTAADVQEVSRQGGQGEEIKCM